MFRSFDPTGWLSKVASKVLYTWIRTRVQPENITELPLDPAKPVCYVLEDKRLTNLLVLLRETRRAGLPPAQAPIKLGASEKAVADHAYFFLKTVQPMATPAREHYGAPTLMTKLVEAALADPAVDVQLVPVTILWGRSPRTQDSILKALFSETWRPTGHFRQWLAVLFLGRQTFVRFNAPLSLRQLIDDEQEQDRTLRKLYRVLRVHFSLQRLRIIGPDLSHRHTQVRTLLSTVSVQQAILKEAAAKNIPPTEARERARRYAWEIPSDYSYGVVRAFELVLNWLWNRIYDGIEVRNFEVVEQLPPGVGIVYLPCHRSHIDYLLLSFLIFRQALTPPHIAAGENLNMPLIGPLLRRGGAFFLRRSFKGDPLYAAVFHEYLHLMLSRGFPIEYFIEGGRSRAGRMLAPRTGILGMTVRSFLRDHNHPLYFVPVYVGYEKLLEGSSFVKELEGKPKSGESLFGVLGTIKKLRHEFGKVHVNFGQPLNLANFLDQEHPEWREADEMALEAAWVRHATQNAANELTRRINAAAVVNPINLTALAVLATPKLAIDEIALHRLIEHYQAFVSPQITGPNVGMRTANPTEIIAHALRLKMVERRAHPLGDLIRVPAGQAALLNYFRNNVLHLFALPSVVACLLSHNPTLARARFEAAVSGIYGLLQPELFMPKVPEQLPEALQAVVQVLAERQLVVLDTEQIAAPAVHSENFADLQLLGESIRPTLERHFLTLALLQHHGSGRLSRRQLEDSGYLLAQRLALLVEFNAPEFSDKAVFAHVVGNLLASGLLTEDAAGLLHFDQRISAPAAHTELLLTADVRMTIRRLAAGGGEIVVSKKK